MDHLAGSTRRSSWRRRSRSIALLSPSRLVIIMIAITFVKGPGVIVRL
jgi:hypothetical protein